MLVAEEHDLAFEEHGSDERHEVGGRGAQIDAVDDRAEREPEVFEGCSELVGSGLEFVAHRLVAHALVLALDAEGGLVERGQQAVERCFGAIDCVGSASGHQPLGRLDRSIVVGVGHGRSGQVGVSRKIRNSRSVMSV